MLALRAGALGDTILTLPALGAMRRAVGPAGRVELLGRFPQARLALGPRYASAVHDIERAPHRALFSEGDEPELSRWLGRFDILVSWASVPGLGGRFGGVLLSGSAAPPAGEGIHATEQLAKALHGAGIVFEAPRLPLLEPEAGDEARADTFLAEAGLDGDFIAIHPSSGSRNKNWHPRNFAALAERALREGYGLLWIEGEADADVVRPLVQQVPAPVAVLGLRTLGAVLGRASLYVGNDSGVTHLAAAYGSRTLAIFGPSDPRCWAPLGSHVQVAKSALTVDELWGIAHDRFLRH